MDQFRRFAIYATPTGALARFGAAWLGWDADAGRAVAQPALAGFGADELAAITATPRRYGFHATIKPPFALAPGTTAQALLGDLRALCRDLAPVRVALALRAMAGCVALAGDGGADAMAARVVAGLDGHRAPLTPADRARRNPDTLSPRQRANLDRWGYPWVMEDFAFHMTLSGALAPRRAAALIAALRPMVPPGPVVVDALTLAGEDAQGRFHNLARVTLEAAGPSL